MRNEGNEGRRGMGEGFPLADTIAPKFLSTHILSRMMLLVARSFGGKI